MSQQSKWLRDFIKSKRKAVAGSLTAENRLLAYHKQLNVDHKPLQYILQSQPFCGLKMRTRRPILIPRPETEQYTDWLINLLRKWALLNARIMDIGCGSGCISVALKSHLPSSKIMAIDINPRAVQLSRLNARRLLSSMDAITIELGDITQPSSNMKAFQPQIIVSNPPYILPEEYINLDLNVKNWEDKGALVGCDSNVDGLFYYRHIVSFAANVLEMRKSLKAIDHDQINRKSLDEDDSSDVEVPSLFLEVGGDIQALQVSELIRKTQLFSQLCIWRDFQGADRVVTAVKSSR